MALTQRSPIREKQGNQKTPKQAVQEIQDNTESAVSKQQVNVKPLKLTTLKRKP